MSSAATPTPGGAEMTSGGHHTLEVYVAAEDVDAASGQLWLLGATAVLERGSGRAVTLVAGFPDRATAEATAVALGGRWPARVAPADDDDWLDAWRAFARPVTVGRLVVRPVWLSPAPAEPLSPPGDDRVVLALEPGRVFGTGSHASTRLALAALDRLVTGGQTVLDLGCGSGVLAVAAALLGAARVVAVDVDPEAVEVTSANAERNGVAGVVDASTAPVSDLTDRFDVVVANIGARALTELAPALVERVAAGGTLVLSGLLEDQWPAVAGACAGLAVVEVATDDGWAAPCLRHRL